MKYCLVTSSEEKCWDKNAALLFLDEGCLKFNQREQLQDIAYEVFHAEINTPDGYRNSRNYVDDLYIRLRDSLGSTLNHYHQVNYDQKSYNILFGWWLIQYIACLYYKYATILEIVKKYQIFSVGVKYDVYPFFNEGCDYINEVVSSDIYNTYISTRIMEWLQLEIVSYNSYKYKKETVQKDSKKQEDYLEILIEKISKRNKKILYCNPIIFSSKDMINTIIFSGACYKHEPSHYINYADYPYNNQLRNELAVNLECRNEFEKMICSFIMKDIPIAYLEAFDTLKKNSIKYFGLDKTHFYSKDAWYNDEFAKAYMSYARKRGMKICGIQHGGTQISCGLSKEFDYLSTNLYYTWGRDQTRMGGNILSAPSPKLSYDIEVFHNIKQKSNKEIVYVTTCEPRYFYRYDSLHRVVLNKYIDNLVKFCKGITKENVACRVRLYQDDYGWFIKERICSEGVNIKFEDWRCSFLESMASCKLYICSILNTTWLEAYVIGIPILLIQDKYYDDYLPDIQKDIDRLRADGICFTSVDEAVRKIAEIDSDIDAWWNGERKESFGRFAQKYSIHSSNWVSYWNHILKENN